MILGGPKYSTELFTYVKESRTFVCERSLLDNARGEMMGPLYDDACDEGFTLVSHKTGAEVMYYYVNKEYDDEGDIIKWIFDEVEKQGKSHRTRVDVFND